MNHRKPIILASLVFAAGLPVMAAHADSGIYIGGGIGKSNIEDSAGNPGGVSFDESAKAGKAFVGYHLDFIPLLKFADEVGYRDLGKPDGSTTGVPVEYKARGLDYGVLAGMGIGPVDLFGRVGGMNYKLQKNIGGIRNDYDGTAPVYGVGIWFTVAGVGVRAEYEKIDIDQLDNAHMMTISAFYQF
ncbi:MAG: outer membrane beta-barrel protein [Betaproteobacteria bacterium]|nr:outer membrane beta-barrel protein [Betaproteobacteria bacterium]